MRGTVMRGGALSALALLATLLPICSPAWGQALAPSGERALTIVMIPGLRADDLTRPDVPALRRLTAESAVGWMNCRTARVPGRRGGVQEPIAAAYATLGAGSRAAAGAWAEAADQAAWQRLESENRALDHPVPLGLLGDLLRRAGQRTALAGNEDDAQPRRAARFVLADSPGRVAVDLAGVSSSPDSAAPYGLRNDLRVYARTVGEPVRLWLFGDLARADRYGPLCLPGMAAWHRAAALAEMDRLLATARAGMRRGDALIVTAPAPADSAAPGDRLAPVLVCAPGAVSAGLLTSGSTHRAGLVTNTDFLPTVARLLALHLPPGEIGRPMGAVNDAGAAATPQQWRALHDRWARSAAKQAAFGGLPLLQFLLVATVLAWSAMRLPHGRRVAAGASLAALCIPLASLLLPLLAPARSWQAAVLLGATIASFAIAGFVRPTRAGSLAVALCGALAAIVAVDLLLGGRLQQDAWMSYSVMEGARYYGIGNEYAGAVAAAALVACAAVLGGGRLARRGALPGTLVSLALMAALVGLPACGANAGGFLGTTIGFAAAAVVWSGRRLSARATVGLVLAAAGAMAALLGVDLLASPGHRTHIALALTSGSSIGGIVLRKLELNGYLLLHSPWSLALGAAAAHLLWQWRDHLAARCARDRAVHGAAVGLVAGGAALLALNDSGVVSAAVLCLTAWGAAVVAGLDKAEAGRHTVPERR